MVQDDRTHKVEMVYDKIKWPQTMNFVTQQKITYAICFNGERMRENERKMHFLRSYLGNRYHLSSKIELMHFGKKKS